MKGINVLLHNLRFFQFVICRLIEYSFSFHAKASYIDVVKLIIFLHCF